MLVDVSTGIIRNLLDPCYWMFDKLTNETDCPDVECIKNIDSAIQNSVIQTRSDAMWLILKNGLDKIIPNCSREEGEQIYRMFDRLMILFKKRLMADIAEPRAIVFTVTEDKKNIFEFEHIKKLIDISCKAQMLYTRISSGKQIAQKTIYYVPNRMLLPDRGLDIKGQYSQVAIKVKDLYKTVIEDVDLPFFLEEKKDKDIKQIKLDL